MVFDLNQLKSKMTFAFAPYIQHSTQEFFKRRSLEPQKVVLPEIKKTKNKNKYTRKKDLLFRHRDDIEYIKKLKELERIEKINNLEKKSLIAEENRENLKSIKSQKRIERAYERLDKQTGVFNKLIEWDRKEKEKEERKLKEKLEKKKIENNLDKFDEVSSDENLMMDRLNYLRRFRNPRKKEGSEMNLKDLLNLSEAELFSASQMMDPKLVEFPVNARKHNPDTTTSDLNNRNKKSSLRRLVKPPPKSLSFDFNSEDIQNARLEHRNYFFTKLIQKEQKARNNTLQTLKLTRSGFGKNHVNTLKDYHEFEARLRKMDALNEKKRHTYGPGEALKTLQTRYLRLSQKTVQELEELCNDAGIDVSKNPHHEG